MKQITSAEFENEVLKSTQPVLVDFYTDDCRPCRMMMPTLEELEAEAKGAFKIVKVDAVSETDLAVNYRVNSVPTFLAFAKGNCVGQTMGSKSKAAMKQWFEESVRSV